MKWLLYHACCIETADTVAAVSHRLQLSTDDIDAPGPSGPSAVFTGKIQDDSFCLLRNIKGTNLFLPLIRGQVVSTPAGAVVNVKMRPNGQGIAFLAVWCALAVLLPLSAVWTGQGADQWLKGQMASLIPAALMWVFAAVLFAIEARRGQEALTAVVRGTQAIASPEGPDQMP